jgi:hypothetical protein
MRLFDWLLGRQQIDLEKIDPEKAEWHRRRAAAHLCKGEYVQAIAELSEAVTCAREDPDLHTGLAVCYEAVEEVTNANRHRCLARRLAKQAAKRRERSRRNQPDMPSKPEVLDVLKEPSAPCHTLKLIGYWAPLSQGYGRHCAYADRQPAWPDIRQAVRAGWRAADRENLLAYLRSGHYYRMFLGHSHCRFDCRTNYRILGSFEQTDGEWIWPEGLYHYVQRHAVILPDEFVASASSRGWKVPPKDQIPPRDEAECDYSLWLQWAKALPRVLEVPSCPDSRVLERFCLVMQRPEEPDGQ